MYNAPMPHSKLRRNTIIGLVASLALAAVKLAAGLIGRSTALTADAVESFADTIGSLFVWQALRVAGRPPDEDHPYGYGKAEAVAALAVGAMLVMAAAFIVVESFRELAVLHPAPAPWTLGVFVGVVVVKELLFRLIIRGADRFDSDAARADAWHHRADAITSAAAFFGVAIAVWGPQITGVQRLVFADEAAALLASGIILNTARRLIRPALAELLDAVAHEMAGKVAEIAGRIDGVREVEKVLVRKSGSGHLADMHLHVDPDSTIRDAHALGHKVKATLLAEIPNLTDVLIHLEPAGEKDEG
jgi:cation diffusion facilitator family transporter